MLAFNIAAAAVTVAAVFGPTLAGDTEENKKARIAAAREAHGKEPGFLMRPAHVSAATAERITSTPFVIGVVATIFGVLIGVDQLMH